MEPDSPRYQYIAREPSSPLYSWPRKSASRPSNAFGSHTTQTPWYSLLPSRKSRNSPPMIMRSRVPPAWSEARSLPNVSVSAAALLMTLSTCGACSSAMREASASAFCRAMVCVPHWETNVSAMNTRTMNGPSISIILPLIPISHLLVPKKQLSFITVKIQKN